MNIEQARDAKQDMTSVYATEDGTMDTAHHGIIVQIGFHESGRNDLVAIEGHLGLKWFPLGAIRLHPREKATTSGTLTDRDVTNEVRAALADDVDGFDVQGIVDELREKFGLFGVTDKLDVEHDDFWAIVAKHELTGDRLLNTMEDKVRKLAAECEQLTPEEIRDSENIGLTGGAVRTWGTRGRALGPDDPHSAAFRG